MTEATCMQHRQGIFKELNKLKIGFLKQEYIDLSFLCVLKRFFFFFNATGIYFLLLAQAVGQAAC